MNVLIDKKITHVQYIDTDLIYIILGSNKSHINHLYSIENKIYSVISIYISNNYTWKSSMAAQAGHATYLPHGRRLGSWILRANVWLPHSERVVTTTQTCVCM